MQLVAFQMGIKMKEKLRKDPGVPRKAVQRLEPHSPAKRSTGQGSTQKVLPGASKTPGCSLSHCSGWWGEPCPDFFPLQQQSGFPAGLPAAPQQHRGCRGSAGALECCGCSLLCSWRWACSTAPPRWQADPGSCGGPRVRTCHRRLTSTVKAY